MELNKIYCCDALEGLKSLEDESINLIITSPPYNKTGLNGYRKPSKVWNRSIIYAGDINADNMPEKDYQKWQIEILNECYRVLKTDGSMFYNHKDRIINGKGEILSPYRWLFQTPFKIRQEIVWNRKSSPSIDNKRFVPVTEKIYWLTKTERPRFVRSKDCQFKTDVWTFQADKNTEHPAPFPLALPNNIIPSVSQGKKIIVLDPFVGSGTVALAALNNNCNYIGFEKFQEYVDMAERKLNNNIYK